MFSNSTYFRGLLGLNKIIHELYFSGCLAHSKHSINVLDVGDEEYIGGGAAESHSC